MGSTEIRAAGQEFLTAWEAAGRPQVEHIRYPSSGRSTHTRLSHGDVLAYSRGGESITDDGEFVELHFSYTPSLAEGVSSRSKLIFQRRAD